MRYPCAVASLLAICSLGGQPLGGSDNMQCVVEMEVPRYSWIARGSVHDTGTVDISFRIGDQLDPRDIQAITPDPRLLEEVVGVLRTGAKFLPSCRGQRVHMLFTFQMEGETSSAPFAIVKFRSAKRRHSCAVPMA